MKESRDHFRQVDRLFDAALDLEPNEWDAYLDGACGSDAALRSRVRTLLDAHERSDGFLKSPAVEMASVLLDEPPTSTQAPERAGPFRIVRELGHGGMGVVYLAEREGGEFQQRVALKLVRHLGSGDAVLRRFLEERRILALLEHPRIAHLVDGGVTSDGLPYFAMELVEGEPIDTYCDARRLSVEQRVGLFVEVCEAVQYAHEHLVIHRDLKPSNILVRADGQLKLLDFGIAKLLDPLRTAEEAATQTGVIALTPEYAAPEQVRGQPVSTATDTYALGVLLYRLLTGQRPYEVRGRTPAEVERIVCEVEPPRPSSTLGIGRGDEDAAARAGPRGSSPEKLRRQLRGDLDVIILKALHKDPARRYASAAAMRDDLERWQSGRPVLARPDSPAYRFGKFVRRNRTAAAASVITLAALVAATAFSIAQMREAQRQRDAALLDNERQSAITEVQMILASDTRGADGQRLSAVERIALAERFVARRFASNPRLTAELLLELATRLVDLGEREAEREMLARAQTVATQADLPAQLARIHCEAAFTLIYDDFLDSARVRLAEAAALLRRPGARTDAGEAVCLQSEGELKIAEGHPDSAVGILTRALAATRGVRAGNPILRQEVMMSMAAALRAVGRTREATAYQRLTLVELEATGYGPTDIFANGVSSLTSALFELGEMAAVDSVVSSVIRNQMAQGAHSSGLLYSLAGIASLRMGELDSAAARFERARRDTTEGAGGLISYLAPATTQLHLERGHPAEARASLARLPGGTLVRRVNRAWFTAWTRYLEGDVRGATAMLEDSLRAIRDDAPRPPPSLAMPFVTAAEWRLAAGDARGADTLALLGRAAAAVDSLALERSAYAGRAELVRARALSAFGKTAEARRAAERAVVAMSSGYGPRNARTLRAVALRDSLAAGPKR